VNAEIGRIVRVRPGSEPAPVTSEAAAFQRFDLSPDGRWLAAVAQTTDGQELRIYDQRGGQRTTWLQAEVVRHPMWSPSGDRLVVTIKNGERHAVLSGMPGSGLPPDTLLAGDSASVAFDVVDFPDEHEIIGQNWRWSLVYRADPTARPLRPDTLITGASPKCFEKRSVSMVAEVITTFRSGRRGSSHFRYPSRKSMFSERSCASSTIRVS